MNSVMSSPWLPSETWRHIVLMTPVIQIVPLSQTCSALHAICILPIVEYAQSEQARMRIIFKSVSLSLEFVARHLGRLLLNDCREIRNAIERAPLELYSSLNTAMVLLRENVLLARGDEIAMQTIFANEGDIDRALVLAQASASEVLENRRLSQLALRDNIPIDTALEIAYRISNIQMQSATLHDLVLSRKNISVELAKVIIESIPDEEWQFFALNELVKKMSLNGRSIS